MVATWSFCNFCSARNKDATTCYHFSQFVSGCDMLQEAQELERIVEETTEDNIRLRTR